MYKQFLSENLKGRAHFAYVSVSRRTKPKCIPEKYVSKLRDFLHLTLDTVNWRFHYENSNEFWRYKSRKTHDRPKINCLLIHCILTFESCTRVQSVPGGMDQTSGECSLC